MGMGRQEMQFMKTRKTKQSSFTTRHGNRSSPLKQGIR